MIEFLVYLDVGERRSRGMLAENVKTRVVVFEIDDGLAVLSSMEDIKIVSTRRAQRGKDNFIFSASSAISELKFNSNRS